MGLANKSHMSKKKRRPTNVDEDQALEIEQLPEAKRMTFAALVRVLLDEALNHRRVIAFTPSEVENRFEEWGIQEVKKLAIACMEFLERNTSNSEGDRFLKDLHHRRTPTNESLVLLADSLDIPVEKLIAVRECFLKEASNGHAGN